MALVPFLLTGLMPDAGAGKGNAALAHLPLAGINGVVEVG